MLPSGGFMPTNPLQASLGQPGSCYLPAPRPPIPVASRTQPWDGPATRPQTPVQPTFRAKGDDEPLPRSNQIAREVRSSLVTIPPPEELGVTSAKPVVSAPVDWSAVHE